LLADYLFGLSFGGKRSWVLTNPTVELDFRREAFLAEVLKREERYDRVKLTEVVEACRMLTSRLHCRQGYNDGRILLFHIRRCWLVYRELAVPLLHTIELSSLRHNALRFMLHSSRNIGSVAQGRWWWRHA